MAANNYFGLDLTSSEQKASACVSIGDNLNILISPMVFTGSDILSLINEAQPDVVAIDSLLSLPDGLCCLNNDCTCQPVNKYKGRLSQQMLAKSGIPCYFTTKKSFINNMVKRAIALKGALDKQGFQVIEVYPYASKTILFGKLKPKTTAAGIRQLREKLSELFNNDRPLIDSWNHDLCDAAMAAYTGLLFSRGDTRALGNTSEGFIYIPSSNYDREIYG